MAKTFRKYIYCNQESSRPDGSGCFSLFRERITLLLVAYNLAQITQNRGKKPSVHRILWCCTQITKSLWLKADFSEVNPAFRWDEHYVGKIKRSLCDITLRLTPHKPVVIPF